MPAGHKTTPEQLRIIKEGRERGILVKAIANQTGLSRATIFNICSREGWVSKKRVGRAPVRAYTVELPENTARVFEKFIASKNKITGHRSKTHHIVTMIKYAMEWMDVEA